MSDEAIVAVAVVETDFGEKVALDSPFDAKDFISVLPWKELSEEVDEHGSLKEKAISRGMGADNVAIKAAEDFEFSDDYAAHPSWEPDALGGDGAWLVDVDSWDKTKEFFEFCGFDVEDKTSL
jgi:hypothetical protein